MKIVKSIILNTINKANESLSVYEQHTDDLGKIHEFRYQCPKGYDVDKALADHALAIPDMFIDSEVQRIESIVENDGDLTQLKSAYLDRPTRIKAVVSAAMRLPANKALRVAGIASKVSDDDLDLLYGQAKRLRIRSRVSGILAIKQSMDDDSGLEEEI